MKRFIIFALLFPPLGMFVFQAPEVVSKGIPPSEEWLAWVIASYPIAIIPALLMAWIDQKLSTQPLHLLKTTASGGLCRRPCWCFSVAFQLRHARGCRVKSKMEGHNECLYSSTPSNMRISIFLINHIKSINLTNVPELGDLAIREAAEHRQRHNGENDMHLETPPSAQPYFNLDDKNLAGRPDDENILSRTALALTSWMERWFPNAFVFVLLAVLFGALGALAIGAPAIGIVKAFGNGFWDLIPFTLQASLVVRSAATWSRVRRWRRAPSDGWRVCQNQDRARLPSSRW